MTFFQEAETFCDGMEGECFRQISPLQLAFLGATDNNLSKGELKETKFEKLKSTLGQHNQK
jgi:hypothetical protein